MIIEVQETAGIRRFQYPVAVRLQLAEPVTRETDFRLLLDNQPVLANSVPPNRAIPSPDGGSIFLWICCPISR